MTGFSYWWPIFLVVASNVLYNMATKYAPGGISPYFSLTVTYLLGAAISFCVFLGTSGPGQLMEGVRRLNWASFALGLAIVGLETGYVYLYRAGWDVSKGSLVANIMLAVVLVGIGVVVYREHFGWQQAAGILLCLAGLVLVNQR